MNLINYVKRIHQKHIFFYSKNAHSNFRHRRSPRKSNFIYFIPSWVCNQILSFVNCNWAQVSENVEFACPQIYSHDATVYFVIFFSIFPAIISCLCSFWRSENEAAFYSIILNEIALSRALSHVGVRLCMLFILCCPFDANAPYICYKQETTTTKNEINQRKKMCIQIHLHTHVAASTSRILHLSLVANGIGQTERPQNRISAEHSLRARQPNVIQTGTK